MEFNLSLLLYAVLQFIAFLFVLVATPLDMFRQRGGARFGNTPCQALWGLKYNCYGVKVGIPSDKLWEDCTGRRNTFRIAQVFVLISICVYGLAALFGFILLCCCSCLRLVCLALNVTGVVTLCVVWASIVMVYEKDDGLCISEKVVSVFGSGFALLVMAWCLDAVNVVLLLLPWPARQVIKSGNPSENGDAKE